VLFGYACQNVACLPGTTLPAYMESVFLAFDAGEVYPNGIRDLSAEERFTRPMVAAILAKDDSSA
jgi:hypothetical protein